MDQVRCFFRQKVAGGQFLAADVGGVLLPHAHRFILAANECLRSPQRQDRAFDALPGDEARLVVRQVDPGRRAVVGAGGRDRRRVAEAADVVLHHVGVDAPPLPQQRADKEANPVVRVGDDQALGDAVGRDQEKPVVIRRGHLPGHVAQHVPGRHDVQHGKPGDRGGEIEGEPVRHAGAAVMADQLEGLEAKLAHEPGLVSGHGPLGIHQPGGIRDGLGGITIAAQVSRDDRMVPGQDRADTTPHKVVLWIAVQQEHGRTRACDSAVDRGAFHIQVPVLEAGQPRRTGRSAVNRCRHSPCSSSALWPCVGRP